LFAPPPLRQLDLGMVLSALAGAINGSLGWLLIVRGRVKSSATMIGEGKHLLTDTLTTVGVLVGLIAAKSTGVALLDPIAALVVAASILWSGVGLLRGAADRLMDRAEPAVLEQIATVLRLQRRPEWIEAHQLRAWSSGPWLHVDLHLTLPRYWDLEAAHEVQRQMSSTIRAALTRPIELMVHTDPCRPEQCVICRVDECPVRAAEFQREPSWDTAMLTGGPSGRAADPVSRW
jgi:cation diffusion facilitator family transporter